MIDFNKGVFSLAGLFFCLRHTSYFEYIEQIFNVELEV
jgi:hypothetical protein